MWWPNASVGSSRPGNRVTTTRSGLRNRWMMPEPQAMTLEEALMLAAERKWKVTFYGYPYSALIEDDFGDDIAHEGNWPESFSEALGYPVVERDDTAELVEAVLRELQSRGVLVDRYEEVFGAKSFDEVVAALAKRKERS